MFRKTVKPLFCKKFMQKEIVNLIEYEKMIKTLLIYLINLSAVLSIPGHTSVFNNLSEINDDTVEIAIK